MPVPLPSTVPETVAFQLGLAEWPTVALLGGELDPIRRSRLRSQAPPNKRPWAPVGLRPLSEGIAFSGVQPGLPAGLDSGRARAVSAGPTPVPCVSRTTKVQRPWCFGPRRIRPKPPPPTPVPRPRLRGSEQTQLWRATGFPTAGQGGTSTRSGAANTGPPSMASRQRTNTAVAHHWVPDSGPRGDLDPIRWLQLRSRMPAAGRAGPQ